MIKNSKLKKKISIISVMTNIRGVSLCSLAMIVTPQYVRDASGSVLFPDRLLHKLHGRGLAKYTICWISLSLFPRLPLFSLLCLFFPPLLEMRIKNPTILRQNKSFLLVRRESLVKGESSRFCSAFVTRDL